MYSKFEGKVEGKIIGKFSKSFANVEEYSRGYSEELKENDPSGNGRGRSTNQAGLFDQKRTSFQESPDRSRTFTFLPEENSMHSSDQKLDDNLMSSKDRAGYFPEKYLKPSRFSFQQKDRFNEFDFEKKNKLQKYGTSAARTFEFEEEEEKHMTQAYPKAGDIYEPQSTSVISRSDFDYEPAGKYSPISPISPGSFGADARFTKTQPVEDTLRKVENSSFHRESFFDDDELEKRRKSKIKYGLESEESIVSHDTSVIEEPIEPPSVQCIHDSHSHFSKTYFMLTKE